MKVIDTTNRYIQKPQRFMAADMRYEGGQYRGGIDFNKIVD